MTRPHASGHEPPRGFQAGYAQIALKVERAKLQFDEPRLSLFDMKEIPTFGTILLAATLAVGCGRDDSSSSSTASDACAQMVACGGDPTGDWKISNFCFNQPSMVSGDVSFCDTAKVVLTGGKVTGTLSYKADKTFKQSAMITATATLSLPGSCIESAGVSCTQIESESNSDPMATTTLTCTPSADNGCQCSSEVQDSSVATGTWAIDKTAVAQTGSDGSTESEDFCVKGTTMYLIQPMSMSMGAMGDMTLLSSLVLSKQ